MGLAYFYIFAILVAVTAVPSPQFPFGPMGPFGNMGPFGTFPFIPPPVEPFANFGGPIGFSNAMQNFMSSVMREVNLNMAQIISDENKFQAIIHVPDFTENDLNVEVRDGSIITQGARGDVGDGNASSNQFSYVYPLPPDAHAHAVTAELRDGKLIVTAPKSLSRSEGPQGNYRKVPVYRS